LFYGRKRDNPKKPPEAPVSDRVLLERREENPDKRFKPSDFEIESNDILEFYKFK